MRIDIYYSVYPRLDERQQATGGVQGYVQLSNASSRTNALAGAGTQKDFLRHIITLKVPPFQGGENGRGEAESRVRVSCHYPLLTTPTICMACTVVCIVPRLIPPPTPLVLMDPYRWPSPRCGSLEGSSHDFGETDEPTLTRMGDACVNGHAYTGSYTFFRVPDCTRSYAHSYTHSYTRPCSPIRPRYSLGAVLFHALSLSLWGAHRTVNVGMLHLLS